MKSLKLQVKSIGQKRPIITKKILLENTLIGEKLSNGEDVLLRELITEIVKLEVNKFNDKVENESVLKYLTNDEIKDKEGTGKISAKSIQNSNNVNFDEAIETAILGFEDGLYFVFIDDNKIESINNIINLNEGSVLMFLRLTFLAGGYF